jgi:hypothetical protein
MKNSQLFILMLIISVSLQTFAQKDEPFKPNGKPEIQIFTNFSASFSDGENFNKFDVTRAYFGYIYNFSKTITGRIILEVGKPSSGNFHYMALLKFAYLQYHFNKLTITGGMLSTPQFELGNKRWGFRYLFKSSHDEYGFGPTADLGVCAVYNFTPWLTADMILINGEGYKLMEADSVLKAGIGVSIFPVKNLLLRGYYDTMKKEDNDQQTLECILSYEDKKCNLSAVYNSQKDRALIAGQDIRGISFHGALFLKGNKKLFARFDHVYSEKIGSSQNPWNLSKDGELYIAGFEFSPANGIKLSPNFQGWQPANKNLPFIARFFLNAEIKL